MARGIEIGSTFGRYRIEAQIGRGGMGVVYRATEPGLGRQVALKVIAPEFADDEGFRKRFERESKLAAAIEHPHAVPIYEAGEQGGVLFLAMRLIDGTDLRTLLRVEDRLEQARAAGIVDQVAGALDEAHARGLVHRDVKPGNILVGSDRGRDHAYLTDFGLTKKMGGVSALTQTGQWVGTIDYVAPEQIEGKRLDARADVYALGCVLYVALTGKVPFEKDSDMAKLFAHVNESPAPPSTLVPGLAPELDEIVERALAKDPDDRYQSAGDLGRAAVAAAAGQRLTTPERTVAAGEAAPPAGAETVVAGGGPPSGRRRWALIGGAALAMLAVVGIVLAVATGADGGGADADQAQAAVGPFAAFDGSNYEYSQRGDRSFKRLERTLDLTGVAAGDEPTLDFRISYDTEAAWDFVFVEGRTVGEDDWTTLPATGEDGAAVTSDDTGDSCGRVLHQIHPWLLRYQGRDCSGSNPETGGEWNAVTGSSDGWRQWSVDLSRYAGSQVEVSISYETDKRKEGRGVAVDRVEVSTADGTTSFEDDGDPANGWTAAGPPPGSAPNPNDWELAGGA
jgi:predicted Ser/Thr protein kinase